MKNLKHRGRDVEVVKLKDDCENCIFRPHCDAGNLAKSAIFERENGLKNCGRARVKYIYKYSPKNPTSLGVGVRQK